MHDLINRIRKTQNAYDAKDRKETELFLIQREIADCFEENLDYESSVLVNGKPQRMWVIHVPDEITARTIKSYPGETFNRGDLIECYGSKWLVTDLDANKQIQTSGKMQQCNRQLIWQNPETLEIVKRWVIASKPYSANLDYGVTLTVSSREFKIQIQYDEETSVLDLGKRFMMEIVDGKPKTYSITAVDQTTNRYDDGSRGFIIINVVQDQDIREKDNVELQICDYIQPHEIVEPIPDELDIKASEFSVKLGGGYRTFSVNTSFDHSGIDFTWDIVATELQRKHLTQDFPFSGSVCKIKCTNSKIDSENAELMFSKFTIILSADGYTPVEKEIEIIGLV